jgi:hypothetical protein
MTATDVLRSAVVDLLERSADAWVRGAPHLAERLFAGAATLLGDFELEPHEDAR